MAKRTSAPRTNGAVRQHFPTPPLPTVIDPDGQPDFLDSSDLGKAAREALSQGMDIKLFDWTQPATTDQMDRNVAALKIWESRRDDKRDTKRRNRSQAPQSDTAEQSKHDNATKVLANVESRLAAESEGSRDDKTRDAIYDLAKFVNDGYLSEAEVTQAVERASRANGLAKDRANGGLAKIRRDIPRGIAKAKADGNSVDWSRFDNLYSDESSPDTTSPDSGESGDDFDDDDTGRTITLKRMSGVKTRVPEWIWEHDGGGRMQKGTQIMFAGRPGTGKSTAARWFAARATRGELEGCWHGTPVAVAVLMTEEQTDVMVAPGLTAADADMDMVFEPEVHLTTGISAGLQVLVDEAALVKTLRDNDIRMLIVDPVISTFGRAVDIYRSNEVRECLEPYTRIAQAIDGLVINLAHLKKGEVRDVLSGINGSSAFGEVPRAVFGFAASDDQDDTQRVMQQVKNSAGPNWLALSYQLPQVEVLTDDGQTAELPLFDIIGKSEQTIADLTSENESDDVPTRSAARDWLERYLQINQPAPSKQVKADAKEAGIGERTLQRARQKLHVAIEAVALPGKPHTTAWRLPYEC